MAGMTNLNPWQRQRTGPQGTTGQGWIYNPLTGALTPPGQTPPPPVSSGGQLSPTVTPPPQTGGGTVPPPAPTPAPPPPPKPLSLPTFQPQQPTVDPRIGQLIQALTKQVGDASNVASRYASDLKGGGGGADLAPRSVERPTLVNDTQSQALQERILALLSGQGPDVGDLSSDPEARAYRLARTREGERQRAEEAEALAASGLTNSGDFQTRRTQIGEGTSEDIAEFEASLTGRRRREMTDTALRAAGLSLSDLARQAALEESRAMGGERAEDRRLMAALEQARLRQSGASSAGSLALQGLGIQTQGTQGLLGLLNQENARKDQFGFMNTQLGAQIAFQQAQLEQQAQDLALRRDQFASDAEFRNAQLDLQTQMFELQRLREELERQLLLQQVRTGRNTLYGAGV